MDVQRAREEFPIWAARLPAPVHIVDEPEWKDVKEQDPEWKWPFTVRFGPFWKKHMILILIAVFLPVWTATACMITGSIVKRNTTQQVTEEMTHFWRGQLQTALDEQDRQRMAAGLLTGEASLQAALDIDADWLARLAGPYATKRMQLTVIWNALVRVANKNYPNTVEGVVNQPQQWMFYSETNPIKADVRELAMEQLKLFNEGRYPAGLSNDFVYGEWSETDYVLRDRWEKDSRTQYWRMPE